MRAGCEPLHPRRMDLAYQTHICRLVEQQQVGLLLRQPCKDQSGLLPVTHCANRSHLRLARDAETAQSGSPNLNHARKEMYIIDHTLTQTAGIVKMKTIQGTLYKRGLYSRTGARVYEKNCKYAQLLNKLVTYLNAKVQRLKLRAHELDRGLLLVQEVSAVLMVPAKNVQSHKVSIGLTATQSNRQIGNY